MSFLILYGTTDGQTAKIARTLGADLRAQGVAVDVIEAARADANPERYDGVIVAASVHMGGFQNSVVKWARAHAAALRGRPTAFLSVCLGILQDDAKVRLELTTIVRRFQTRTGWQPGEVKFVAGALPYSRYNWLKKWVMRRIVRKAGVETDPHRDYEYTDWKDLAQFARAFVQRCEVVSR
jgi:menaquinone-dependent protoporphyrinogen oxidase